MAQRLQMVPFEPTWLEHSSLDLHAIYLRPTQKRNLDTDKMEYDRDADGFVQWNATTALPVRKHYAWLAKGFRYLTLATPEDIARATDPKIIQRGALPLGMREKHPTERPQDYVVQPSGVRGPWNVRVWLEDGAAERRERRARVIANIKEHGAAYAELAEQRDDRDYVLPQALVDEALKPPALPDDEPMAVVVPDVVPPKRKRGRPRKNPQTEAVPAV